MRLNKINRQGSIGYGSRNNRGWTPQINQYLSGLQSAGLLDKMDRVFIFIDSNYLKDRLGVGGDAIIEDAIIWEKGRGVTKSYLGTGSIDLGYNPVTDGDNYILNSSHFSVFVSENFPYNGYLLAADDNPRYAGIALTNAVAASCSFALNGIFKTGAEATQTIRGSHIVSTNSTILSQYVNGVLKKAYTLAPSALPNANFKAFKITGASASYNKLVLVTIGGYLDGSESLALSNLQNEFFNSLNYEVEKVYSKGGVSYYLDDRYRVLAQNGNYKFANNYSTIYFSSDGGENWTSKAFTGAYNIKFAHVFSNGNIIFADRTKMYASTDGMANYVEITVYDTDGTTPYVAHTPISATYPGNYFQMLDVSDVSVVAEREMIVWGNYCNVTGGATPVNIYHAFDDVLSAQVAYKFGQNPFKKDNGLTGGGTTGNLLGDATNPLYVSHIHSTRFDSDNNKWYVATGDVVRDGNSENKWMTGVYDEEEETWTWIELLTDSINPRYRCAGLSVKDGYIYWISDNTLNPLEKGIYKCLIADAAIPDNHERIYTPDDYGTDLILDGNNIIATSAVAPNQLYISRDLGETWVTVVFDNIVGAFRFLHISKPDSRGYYSCLTQYNVFSPDTPSFWFKLN